MRTALALPGDVEDVPASLYTALVVAGQIIAVSLIIAIGAPEIGYNGAGAYLFAVGFGLVLVVRRRFPVTVLAVTVVGVFAYYAIGEYPPIGMAVPAVVALYAASVRGRAGAALLSGAVLLAVSLYFRVRQDESSAVLAYDLLTNAALVGVAVALALAVRSRRQLREQQQTILLLQQEREREEVARRVQAERLRIARDLHDSVGHALSVVSVHGKVAQEALGVDQAAASRSLKSVVETARTSLHDLRGILDMLRSEEEPDAVTPHGRVPLTLGGIDQLASAARDAGLTVRTSVRVDDGRVPASVATTAFRIVQEAVTNTLRHASASEVDIDVSLGDRGLQIQVTDDGVGTDGTREGSGLAGMRERASMHGGRVTVREAGTGGCQVYAVLPIGTDARS